MGESAVDERYNNLIFNGKSVFLSGVNFAWKFYGYDFGNGQYAANSNTTFEQWLKEVATYGGNSVRVWLHVEGDNTHPTMPMVTL